MLVGTIILYIYIECAYNMHIYLILFAFFFVGPWATLLQKHTVEHSSLLAIQGRKWPMVEMNRNFKKQKMIAWILSVLRIAQLNCYSLVWGQVGMIRNFPKQNNNNNNMSNSKNIKQLIKCMIPISCLIPTMSSQLEVVHQVDENWWFHKARGLTQQVPHDMNKDSGIKAVKIVGFNKN